ncbi:hypothetical protein HDU93_006014 [Gonapodya sp. JEL0774]|nr:hypothetical protein HDU93_006014 [Gonapodya sp. JEL0774]
MAAPTNNAPLPAPSAPALPSMPAGQPPQQYYAPPPNQPAQYYVPPAVDPKAPAVIVQQVQPQYNILNPAVEFTPIKDNTWKMQTQVITSDRLVLVRVIQFVLMFINFICLCAAAASNRWLTYYGSYGWFWWTMITSLLVSVHIIMFNLFGAYQNKIYNAFPQHQRRMYFYLVPIVYDCIAWIEWISAAGSAASVSTLCNDYLNVVINCGSWTAAAAFGFFVWFSFWATLALRFLNHRKAAAAAQAPVTMGTVGA